MNQTTGQRKYGDLRTAMLFLLPNLLGLLVFVALPVLFSLVMAFTNWDLTQREPFEFVGWDNFTGLLWGAESQTFWKYFLNTVYLLMGLPLSIAGSLALALMMHRPIAAGRSFRANLWAGLTCLVLGLAGAWILFHAGRLDAAFAVALVLGIAGLGLWLGQGFFRTLFYLPQFTAGVAMYILWRNLFNPGSGLVNQILGFFLDGFETLTGVQLGLPRWLVSVDNLWGLGPEQLAPAWSFFGLGARDALILMGVWAGLGGSNCLLYLAGLANVPDELYEVAQLDGAGSWAQFRYVTWPALAPTTFFIVIISTIAGLQGGFEQARVMTSGGPAGTTTTLGYYIYNVGFEQYQLGLASAIAWIMFVMIFAMTLVNWRFGHRYVNV